jgi:hypothetical protein
VGAAIELLGEGEQVGWGDIRIRLEGEDVVVDIESTWHRENTTEETMRRDLETAKRELSELEEAVPPLASLFAGRPRVVRVIEDWSMGWAVICGTREES